MTKNVDANYIENYLKMNGKVEKALHRIFDMICDLDTENVLVSCEYSDIEHLIVKSSKDHFIITYYYLYWGIGGASEIMKAGLTINHNWLTMSDEELILAIHKRLSKKHDDLHESLKCQHLHSLKRLVEWLKLERSVTEYPEDLATSVKYIIDRLSDETKDNSLSKTRSDIIKGIVDNWPEWKKGVTLTKDSVKDTPVYALDQLSDLEKGQNF